MFLFPIIGCTVLGSLFSVLVFLFSNHLLINPFYNHKVTYVYL
jgi:hypothetical protein